MSQTILGLHHVTAIAGDAKRNYQFYTQILGQRLVKKTVNFDDPETYHFYYGTETGSPGTILTFFPWGRGMRGGRRGVGQTTEVAYSVPAGSLAFWKERMDAHHILYNNVYEKFGDQYLTILDPDGLKIELTVPQQADDRAPWSGGGINPAHAIKGFHQVTITTTKIDATAKVLTELLGYTLYKQEVNRYRFVHPSAEHAAFVDLVEVPGEALAQSGAGSIHHIAFRVSDQATLMHFREKIAASGLLITDKIDRNYFYSLYFREPGGVLFEIATDEPGFMVDEDLHSLGSDLKLPAQFEPYRNRLLDVLPKLD
jgi:glyoxalase family protein